MKIQSIQSLRKHRSLIYQFTKREIMMKYKGSIMGYTWAILNPMIMLTVYTIVFSRIFNARWSEGGEIGSTYEYGANLLRD